jgi:hypothetical protein
LQYFLELALEDSTFLSGTDLPIQDTGSVSTFLTTSQPRKTPHAHSTRHTYTATCLPFPYVQYRRMCHTVTTLDPRVMRTMPARMCHIVTILDPRVMRTMPATPHLHYKLLTLSFSLRVKGLPNVGKTNLNSQLYNNPTQENGSCRLCTSSGPHLHCNLLMLSSSLRVKGLTQYCNASYSWLFKLIFPILG